MSLGRLCLTMGSYTQLSVVAANWFLSFFIVFSSVRTRDFHSSLLHYPWEKMGTTVYFTTLIFLSRLYIFFFQTLHKPAHFHLGDWGSFFFRFIYHCRKYKRNWPRVQASLFQCTKYHNYFRLHLFLLCITVFKLIKITTKVNHRGKWRAPYGTFSPNSHRV